MGATRASAADAATASRRGGLTTRAAVLGLVVCAIVVSAALPLRELLTQRAAIATLEQQQAAQRQRVAALEQHKQRLQDPPYIEGLARQRLHFVLPGETAYVVLPPPGAARPAPAPATPPATAAGPDSPWYSQLWGSIRAADRAR